MASLAVMAGAFIASGFEIVNEWFSVSLAMFVVFLFTGGGNAINDYIDRDIDKKNHPERPIPSGEIRAENAGLIGATSLAVPIFIGILINIHSFMIILVAEILMVSYELIYKKKGLTGNVEISILVGLLFLFGGASTGNMEKTVIFSIMASLATFGREIVKDIEDMEGDINRITLPKRIGRDRAGIVAATAFMAAVSLSSIPFRDFGMIYLIIVSVADVLFFYASYLAMVNPEKSQKIAKISMLIGLLAFLAGALQ